MGRRRCRRVNDINSKALIKQSYKREGCCTSVHVNGSYHCAASLSLVVSDQEELKTHKGTKH